MKCDICGAREATVHLTEVINDSITKLHLCEECAQAKGDEIESHFGLNDLLSGLMDMGPGTQKEKKEKLIKLKCPSCGMTFYDIQEKGRMGCGKCYEQFADNISALLRKIHGADRHVGKMPARSDEAAEKQQDFLVLKKKLQELVNREDFEEAAVLRDKIKTLEDKIKANNGKN